MDPETFTHLSKFIQTHVADIARHGSQHQLEILINDLKEHIKLAKRRKMVRFGDTESRRET